MNNDVFVHLYVYSIAGMIMVVTEVWNVKQIQISEEKFIKLKEIKMKTLDRIETKNLKENASSPLCFIFAVRVREELIIQGIDQAKLAEDAECSKGSISDYLNAKTEPKIQALLNISNVLNVNSDYLLGRTNVKSRNIDYMEVSKITGLNDLAIEKLKAIRSWGEDIKDNKTIDAVNELLTNQNSKYFFGNLGEYFYGGEYEDDLTYIGASVNQKNTTRVISKKNLSKKLSVANLMEMQEMIVLTKKSIEEKGGKL